VTGALSGDVSVVPDNDLSRHGWVQLCEGSKELSAGLAAWLASKDPARLGKDVKVTGGTIRVRLDGRDLDLRHGDHFELPVTAAAAKVGLSADTNMSNGTA
jgi:hypothetical protein